MNADLVVLSACESGVGKLVTGEGFISMSRAFSSTGVSNLVFSLWKVTDVYAKEIMLSFYSELLKGESYSNSLRKAKMKMIKSKNMSIPILWSCFLLIGN